MDVRSSASFIFLYLSLCGHSETLSSVSKPSWDGTTVEDLWNEYYNIFPTQNRNAAAFRWSTFLLERSWQMSPETFEHLSGGYCAVAAAIVKPQARSRYRLKLPVIGGGMQQGLMYYCCWPCICDTLDFLKVDTKTVLLKDGLSRTYNFAVMGNPCKNPSALKAPYIEPFSGQKTTLSHQAPEVKCTADGRLEGATTSDNGHVIMAMFFEDSGQQANPQQYFTKQCKERAQGGYRSGMGLIFRKVAGASPITSFAALPESLPQSNVTQTFRPSLKSSDVKYGADPVEGRMQCPFSAAITVANETAAIPRIALSDIRKGITQPLHKSVPRILRQS